MSASTEKKNRIASRETGTDKKLIAQKEEQAKKAREKKKLNIGIVAVLVVIAIVLFLSSPLVYKCTTAATVDGQSYSPAEMNYFYANQYYNFAQQYGQYAAYFGLDTQYGLSGLKSQASSMTESGTWRDYFIDEALSSMAQYKAINEYAAENGIALTDEELAAIQADFAELETYAKEGGFPSVKKFLSAYYGNGVTEKIARDEAQIVALAAKTTAEYAQGLEYTPEQLEEKYASYEGSRDYFDVCYYNVYAEKIEIEAEEEGGEPTAAATDETRAAAKATAEAILEAYNSEELAEESDVEIRLNEALARAGVDGECIHSARTAGSNISAYKEWAMGERSEGDATIAENTAADAYVVAAFISRDRNEYKLAQVRHILVKAEADENGEFTDEAKAAARARAEEIYEEWKSGEKTEESFAALAEQYSEDLGSSTNGGLYDNVQKGQMVEEFDAFCFAKHKQGDSAVVYGEAAGSYAGYHVMYYVGQGERCCDYMADSDLRNTDTQAWLDGLTENSQSEKGFWVRYVG